MRQRLVRLFAFIALVVLPAGSAAASDAGFVYALRQVNGASNEIYGFRLDPVTGGLTPLPGFPMASGGTGVASTTASEMMTYVGGRLYVINDGNNTLSVFNVDQATGALTALPFNPVALGTGVWACVAARAGGSPVFIGDSNGTTIASFVVTETSATAAAGSPYTTSGAPPFSCTVSRDGSYVYAGGNSGTAIAGFSINSSTGVLTPLVGSPFNSGGSNPLGYATDSAGRLFSVNAVANQVRAFTTAAGVPTGVTGNPFAAGGLSLGVAGVLHPSGFYIVADRGGNKVGVYQIAGSGSATTLAGVAGSPFASGGTFTDALALTSDGGLLIAANGTSRNLTVFRVEHATGGLTSLGTQPADTLGVSGGVTAVAFAPFADAPLNFVYALQQVSGGANQVHGFSLDSATGALTLLPGFPVASGGTGTGVPASEQVAYARGRLYVLNDGSDTMSAFSVNQSTGALTALPFSPIALGPGGWYCVAVHPNGSPVVAGKGAFSLSSFVVTATTAAAASGSPFTTGAAQPGSCHFSGGGTYIYAGGADGTTIAGFSVDSASGVLTALAGSPFDSGASSPNGYATDSSGRLFSANWSSGHVRAFTTAAGVPTGVTGNPFASGLTEAVHGVLHPSGFYLVADRVGDRVGVYQIGGSGAATTLNAVVGSPFASGSGASYTDALALTMDGVRLVAANGTSRNLTVFQVNASTGSLTSPSVQAPNTLGSTGIVTGLALVRGKGHSNAGTITLPDSGMGAPYPSSIVVPSGGGPVAKVTVTLRGFSHTWPADVDVLLVGPGGQSAVLMSDVGSGTNVSNLTLTFDDSGAALGTGVLSSGTYRPTNLADPGGVEPDAFPSPAPAGPYGTSLSVFNGTDPAGTWSLYVLDDSPEDTGAFSRGWSLEALVFDAFTDDPIVAGVTAIKAAHITDLRARIDAIRTAHGLGAFAWGPAVAAGTTAILGTHISDLREALRQAYVAAGVPAPIYTDTTVSSGATAIRAIHILEIRNAILAIE